jgi:probable F420-dependent oxidoreductase
VKLGVVFPQTEIGDDADGIRGYALGVEKAGFEFLSAYDHVMGHHPDDPERWRQRGPYTDEHPFHEVFVLFSHLAAITATLEFATEVLVLPLRQTVLVAKQAAELQLLSGGRLRLGVGVGWNVEEFRAMGVNFHDRGQRVVEQVELLRRLWGEDLVTLLGRFHDVRQGGLKPQLRRQQIPIWIGGRAKVVLERAAALADGFMLEHSVEEAPTVIDELNRIRKERNRESMPFGLAVRLHIRENDLPGAIKTARRWKELGISHLSVETMDEGITGPSRHLQLAEAFMSAWKQ